MATAPALADDAAPASDDVRLARLGEHFYARGMFYRAVGAFEELDLFTADPAVRRYARLRLAMAYHRGGQYDDAIAAYDRLLDDASADEAGGWIRIHRSLARAERALNDPHAEPPDVVAAELSPLALDDAPYATIAGYHVVRLRLLAGDNRGAREARATLDRRCRDRPVDDCAVLGRLDRGLALPPPRRRSPALALTMSAVVPGLGSAYSGNVVDGIYYASLTSLFVLGAWDVHDPSRSFGDQKVTFYALGTAAVVTYAANVVQAYFGAKRFNLVQQLGWRARVLGATEIPLPYDERSPPGALR
jgi:tetratricopeptide (TPR) repeat protein